MDNGPTGAVMIERSDANAARFTGSVMRAFVGAPDIRLVIRLKWAASAKPAP